MSWESTRTYYELINREVTRRLGGHHSADLLLASVDFAPIEAWQRAANWSAAGQHLAEAAVRLEGAGADFLALCTNTMHKVASTIEAAVAIPLVHIAAPTIVACRRSRHRRVGLLGTRFTMEDDFYRARLERADLDVLVPDANDRATVHRIIYDELCQGSVEPASVAALEAVVGRLSAQGAQAVVLGCTELGMLGCQTAVPLLDTTVLHAAAVVDEMLA